MKELFVHIYTFFEKRRILLFGLFFLLIGMFAFFASQLHIESDLNAILPKNKSEKDVTSILSNNKQLDRIVCSVSSIDSTLIDPDLLVAFTDELSESIIANDKHHLIQSIESKQDEEQFLNLIQAVQSNLPFLLNEKDYAKIDALISEEGIKKSLENNYKTLVSPGGIAMKQLIQNDPLGISYIAIQKLQNLQLDDNTQLYDGYILNSNQTQLTFFIHPTYPSAKTKENKGLAPLIDNAINELQKKEEYKNISCHYFGGQLVASGNASQMQSDTFLTLSITIALLLLLFVSFFRNFLAPLQVMIPVIFGGLFGMAMMYLLKGSVSVMALGSSSVILGIAVNYSLHFMSHFRHENSKTETIRALTLPMTIGGFTTIAAFLSLQLVHAPVLQELGLFTAFNLIGSSLCTLIFLPHFITQSKNIKAQHPTWIDKISLLKPNENKWFVIGILGITLFLSFFINKVRFNEDMMKMNLMSHDLQTNQDTINARNSESLNSIFCVSEGKTFDEALNSCKSSSNKLQELKSQNIIKRYQPISDFLFSKEEEAKKLTLWNNYWSDAKKATTIQRLATHGNALGFDASAFLPIKSTLYKNYISTDSIYNTTFTKLFKDLVIQDTSGYKIISLVKTNQSHRSDVYKAFEGVQQSYITDRQLITSKFVQYIKDDFYKILYYTSFIVFFVILISYGRIEIALISFIPMLITWICILGLMGLFGIEFNIINIIISTLIFGLGDDYSIFITDGLLEKYKYGKHTIHSTKTSIILSAITTIIGLGILIFAKHPALRSIAAVSVIGILAILFVSQTIQPFLFNFFIQRRADKKFHPFTLWSFTKTVYAFTYYALGCFAVTIVGFILTKCIPFAKDKMKYVYHVVICKMMWSLLYMMANVTKRFQNKDIADLEKPSLIIANHASFLDLLRIISLQPKILLMTNKWVWRSPVFGALVRMADYYPVEEGAEFSVEKLKYWVDRGYSIAVFPEGTRSTDDVIKRFHKGAFYLAEKLQLDITPAIFHGIGYTIRKGDFLLKNGFISVKFLPRITPDDTTYGTSYSERARKIGKYFRDEYEIYRAENETPNYFKEQLIKNYIYKGPILEWYCRIKIKLEHYYEPIEKLVPKSGNILDIGCGYGFLDYILSWTSKDRTITGIDYDDEKIQVANHNFSKTESINFTRCDALDFDSSNQYDCIIILDVLHYLTPEKQNVLFEKMVSALSSGGKLILRDGLEDLGKKHKGTILTEIMSTKIFNFNKTENDLNYISKEFLAEQANTHRLQLDIIDQTKFTSNIIAVFTKS